MSKFDRIFAASPMPKAIYKEKKKKKKKIQKLTTYDEKKFKNTKFYKISKKYKSKY